MKELFKHCEHAETGRLFHHVGLLSGKYLLGGRHLRCRSLAEHRGQEGL